MSLARFRNPTSGPRRHRQPTPKPRRTWLLLEQLEDRTVPANFTASTVSQLIADINAANAAGGSNTIVLAANTAFDLTTVNNTANGANGLPVIAARDNLSITGQGGDIIQRDTTAPAFRLLDVASKASLTLTDLTLQNGLAFGSGSSAEGGAIYSQGSVALNGVTVQNNSAVGSNGVSGKPGSVNGQDAEGGGIWSSGNLALANGTVVQSNQAVGGNGAGRGAGGNALGGGLCIAGGTANLTGATLNNNSVQGGAGGYTYIYNPNDTYPVPVPFGPGGSGFGGALYVDGAATVTLCSDVAEDNTAAGGSGGSYGQGEGGGIYFVPKTTVYLDSFTLTNTINNTDNSGKNGNTANINGTYILQNC
jgi:hypothetical protein